VIGDQSSTRRRRSQSQLRRRPAAPPGPSPYDAEEPIHATLIAFGHPCPVSDLFGHAGRELLDRLAIPDPWRRNVEVSLQLIDDLELQLAQLTVQLKRQGAHHRYIPLLVTAPGLGWINAYTIASELGDIGRFASPAKLCGYTGLCPRVKQSGATDRRGPISKHGPKYLRWALFAAALNACKHPLYAVARSRHPRPCGGMSASRSRRRRRPAFRVRGRRRVGRRARGPRLALGCPGCSRRPRLTSGRRSVVDTGRRG
jgi:hypothetical protein